MFPGLLTSATTDLKESTYPGPHDEIQEKVSAWRRSGLSRPSGAPAGADGWPARAATEVHPVTAVAIAASIDFHGV